MSHESASTDGRAARLQAVEDLLRQAVADVATLGELGGRLSQSLEALGSEVGALAEELRADASTAREAPAEPPVTRSTDVDGARLVALNMALGGDSREQTARYLEENFEIADREALLDEVYAAIDG